MRIRQLINHRQKCKKYEGNDKELYSVLNLCENENIIDQ